MDGAAAADVDEDTTRGYAPPGSWLLWFDDQRALWALEPLVHGFFRLLFVVRVASDRRPPRTAAGGSRAEYYNKNWPSSARPALVGRLWAIGSPSPSAPRRP